MAGNKQEDLANYLGLTLQQIQKYENGKNKVSVSVLIKVTEYFKIPITYFIPSEDAKMSQRKAPVPLHEISALNG